MSSSEGPMDTVPGVAVNHVPASTGCYVGSPSIVVLPDGSYVTSHDLFGARATNDTTLIFRSADRGLHWNQIAAIKGQVWSTLFLHDQSLYIFGTDHCDRHGGRLNGVVVIRRSDDGGATWTKAHGAQSGLLTEGEGWHCAPVPVIRHNGRIWRAFEFASEPDRRTWRVVVLSAPEDGNLLDRATWRFSEQLDHLWSESQWIEGNIAVGPDDSLVDLLRVNDQPRENVPDKAAIVHVSDDGLHLSHDRKHDVIDFPGGGSKFTVRRHRETGRYISLVNIQSNPPSYRNRLYLTSSEDLRSWDVHTKLLYHPDDTKHAFQYVDWVFDADHIIYVCRTAFDDRTGGADRAHDANFLTFHRIEDFQSLLKERL